jgi:hypothetical protein
MKWNETKALLINWKKFITHYFYFFDGTGVWTKSLSLARQTLNNHLNQGSKPNNSEFYIQTNYFTDLETLALTQKYY